MYNHVLDGVPYPPMGRGQFLSQKQVQLSMMLMCHGVIGHLAYGSDWPIMLWLVHFNPHLIQNPHAPTALRIHYICWFSWIDGNVTWHVDSDGRKEWCIRQRSRSPGNKGHFGGNSRPLKCLSYWLGLLHTNMPIALFLLDSWQHTSVCCVFWAKGLVQIVLIRFCGNIAVLGLSKAYKYSTTSWGHYDHAHFPGASCILVTVAYGKYPVHNSNWP